ncbi:TetR/AcrR family transcriptional regulator [Sorangium sp. So ce426]|uniref:TetR/AcrR family transcriptional regulator n=1 Tax=Sorangium sp. So ce426 TaxID=3133312 RepID=UPI003F5B539A
MSASVRNAERTCDRILSTALEEFSLHGFSGARVDVIARRACINKRMLYHYFGSKKGLYREIVRRKLAEKDELRWNDPDDPRQGLPFWYDIARNDVTWVRLMQWEALDSGDGEVVGEPERRLRIKAICKALRARQEKGLLPRELETEPLLLMMIGLSIMPTAFPQVTRIVTGTSPDDEMFQRRWMTFLNHFAEYLTPREKKGGSP